MGHLYHGYVKQPDGNIVAHFQTPREHPRCPRYTRTRWWHRPWQPSTMRSGRWNLGIMDTRFVIAGYPLVNQHSYGKSPFLMGKLTIDGHFQYVKLPEGNGWLFFAPIWWGSNNRFCHVLSLKHESRVSPIFYVFVCPFWFLAENIPGF
jgi:hypothetical protein